MADIRLRTGGREYSGWKTVRVTRSIESVAGSFDLGVSERWSGQAERWPINEEDECSIVLNDEVLITGYVDRRSLSYGPEEHSLSVSGRDKTGSLVDCSAVLKKWEFSGVSLSKFAALVAAPFGIQVTVQPGLSFPTPLKRFVIDPGESAFEAIERACRSSGVLPISDGKGGLVLSRAGGFHASTALIEGQNILNASAEYDASGKFRTYKVLGQHHGNDSFSGVAAASVKATAQDTTVRRAERILLIRPEGDVTTEHAKQRAQWEASVRAGRADTAAITVQGWEQGNGAPWEVNQLVSVQSPLLGIAGDLLITQLTFSLDTSGTTTQLSLKTPSAFSPEPVITKANYQWKEIVKGV